MPDLPTIHRRRFALTTVLRITAGAVLAWQAYHLLKTIVNAAFPFSNLLDPATWLFVFRDHAPAILFATLLILFEKRIIRWLVPTPPPSTACPKCGYPMKDLRAPICPECGTDLRPRAP